MMKKNVVGTLFCISLLSGHLSAKSAVEEELVTAIKSLNEEKVRLLLRDNPILDKESKKNLLVDAEQSVKHHEKSSVLLQNGWDRLAFGGGLGSLGVGAVCSAAALTNYFSPSMLIDGAKSRHAKDPSVRIPTPESIQTFTVFCTGSGIALLGLGVYLVKRGWDCKAALHSFEKATEIKSLIEKAPIS